jgi:hypothetical protein
MKKFLPHLIALAAFVVIVMIYFAPLMSGKELRQSDINNWKGMSKEILDYKEKTGEQTFWTNSMFGGMPAYQISAEYSADLVQYIDKVLTLGLPIPANYLFLLMAGFYFLLIILKVDSKVSILGSVAFAFSSYFLLFIVTGHNSKVHAVAYMAPVVAGIIMSYRGRYLLGASITALALALHLYANHLQITYYLMLLIGIFVITELILSIKQKRIASFIKASSFLVIGAVLAVSTNITNLWATQEYGKYSTRGPSELTSDKENQTSGLDRDYITQWSFGIDETFTLLIPDFKGGASEPIGRNNKDALNAVDENFRQYVTNYGAYFGDQPFTGGPSYFGAIVILLFVIGLFVIKGPLKWWLVISTLLSLMLSWGHNFMTFTNLFLDFVPGYDKFRAVTTIIVIAQFAVPLLGILAVNQMITEKDFFRNHKKQLMYAMGIVIGFTLLVSVAPGTFTNFYTPREYQQVEESVKGQPNSQQILDGFFAAVSTARQHIMVSDAVRSLVFLILAAVLIWTFLKFGYKKVYFIYGMIALVLMDLASVDRRYLSSDDFLKKTANAIPFPKTEADEIIDQDTTKSYRVINIGANTFNDASTSYYHQSLGGYHGAKLKRYKELIDNNLDNEIATLKVAMQRGDSTAEYLFYNQPAINMLNAKYIIVKSDQPPVLNKGALGNAWFVPAVKFVANADSELAAIRRFDPKSVAIVDARFKNKIEGMNFTGFDPEAKIILTDYKPDHLTYKSSAKAEQFAVFSEIYYDKGWNAYIDGKLSDYVRADYVLRAMRVPPGEHTVEFKFEPVVIQTGEKIAFASSLILILLFGFVVYKEAREQKM